MKAAFTAESTPGRGCVAITPSRASVSENSLPKFASAIPSPPKISPSNSCVASSSIIAAPSVAYDIKTTESQSATAVARVDASKSVGSYPVLAHRSPPIAASKLSARPEP